MMLHVRGPGCCLASRYTRGVDAEPLLGEVARRFHEASLEAVLIGNAAAALQRPRDRAVLDILEASREKATRPPGAARRPRSRE